MKFKKIAAYFQPNEQVVAKLKPRVGHVMKFTVLVALITVLVLLLPCTYFIVIDLLGAFLFFVGLCAFAFLVVVIASLVTYKKLEYVITDKNLYVPAGSQLVICALNDLTITNEQKIHDKKRKIDTIILKGHKQIIPIGFMGRFQSAPLGLAQITAQAMLRHGKIRLQSVENPEQAIILLKKYTD